MSYLENSKPVTLTSLAAMRASGEKIVMLTAYDASFAAVEERCGVDVILVGDSLGNVIQGHASTRPGSYRERQGMLSAYVLRSRRRSDLWIDPPRS
jgi:3-methyl-2-oxobutanoate hydroxymethyltransferase